MKMQDIKTLITSGTIILAVGLYLVFAPEQETPVDTSTQNQSTAEQTLPTADDMITPEYATNATGNDLLDVEYLLVNDGLSL